MPTLVKELYEDGGYHEDTRGRRAVRSFAVYSPEAGINAAQAYEAVGIKIGDPLYGDAGEDLGLRVMNIDGKPNRSPYNWRVVVLYSNTPAEGPPFQVGGNSNHLGDGGIDSLGGAGLADGSGSGAPSYPPPGPPSASPQLVPNPLDRPAQISWGTGKLTRVIERDTEQNKPIVNKAQLPFDPPLEREVYFDVLTVVKNQRQYQAREMSRWKGAINNAKWLGDEKYTWKVDDITATREYEEGIFFWKVTYVLHWWEETWKVKVLNAGTWQLNAAGDNWERCVDKFGSPASRPVPLNSSGRQIAVSGGSYVTAPTFLEFTTNKLYDFAALQLFKPDA